MTAPTRIGAQQAAIREDAPELGDRIVAARPASALLVERTH
jgi:hypothetical protein